MLAQALGNQVDVQFAAAKAIKIAVLPCHRQSMAVKDIECVPAECSTNGLRRHLRHLKNEDVRALPIRRMLRGTSLAEPTPDVPVGQLNRVELCFVGWRASGAFDLECSFVEEQAQELSTQHAS